MTTQAAQKREGASVPSMHALTPSLEVEEGYG